jgi:hypothetical protein
MVAAFIRVGLVAIYTFVVVPTLGGTPESILIVSTVAAFVEGGLGLLLLRRFLGALPRTPGGGAGPRASSGGSMPGSWDGPPSPAVPGFSRPVTSTVR